MAKWKKIRILIQNVVYVSDRSVLIAMPHRSDYDGFKFWHPLKITEIEDEEMPIEILYTDEFVFRLFKNGKGKYNYKEVIDRVEVKASDIEDAFNHDAPLSEFELHVPEKLQAEKVEVLEELRDD